MQIVNQLYNGKLSKTLKKTLQFFTFS